jgi:hypothetical protein
MYTMQYERDMNIRKSRQRCGGRWGPHLSLIAGRTPYRVGNRVVAGLVGSLLAAAALITQAPRPASASVTFYEVRAEHSDKCLDVAWASTAHAADVIQGNCVGGANQHWRLATVGGGFYEIRAQHSDKCLDVAWASTAHMANVIQGNCVGGANQHWRLV